MPGDTRHTKQRVELTVEYVEVISENDTPQPGKPEIVVTPEGHVRVRKAHITRVFYYLTASSALCLGTVALVPKPAVQATAIAIWAGSAATARYLLPAPHPKPGKSPTRPTAPRR
jgi:hypothetical protein